MTKMKLTIEAFKCFKQETSFHLNRLTLLTGANSVGKSSVVQALLLLKKIAQGSISEAEPLLELNLNDEACALSLGTYDDIQHKSNNTYDDFMNLDTRDIRFVLDEAEACIRIQDNLEADSSVHVYTDTLSLQRLHTRLGSDFVYLNAERQAPRYEYEYADSRMYCDCHGANTGDVIQHHEKDDCPELRSFGFHTGNKWKVELDRWISYVFPGVMLQVSPVSEKNYQVKVLGNAAPNVGFGITYVLPVLVSGLTVPEGGTLIVENPEAHLHAKAQSHIGYFLARMAAAGVRVLVETHSEHVVNGIRRMIVEAKTRLSAEDVTIYFFQDPQDPTEIGMDPLGNLTEFPVDFFDQVRQDTLAVLRMNRNKQSAD